MSTTVKVKHRGPLVIEGDFKIVDPAGHELCPADARRVALCRCGASRTRPLCDGSHHRIGFEAEAKEEG